LVLAVLVALSGGLAHAATAIPSPTAYDNGTVQSGAKATHMLRQVSGFTVNAVYGVVEEPHALGSNPGSPSGAAGRGRWRIAVSAANLTRTRRGGSRGRFLTDWRYFKDLRPFMTSPASLDACSVHGNGARRVRTQLE
jgi:hypothetical protein